MKTILFLVCFLISSISYADPLLLSFLNNKATTYGYGEKSCGSKVARKCDTNRVTKSGMRFSPDTIPTAAIVNPTRIFVPFVVYLKGVDGKCHPILVNDTKHPKSNKHWDLTPAALNKLGIKVSKYWSGAVEVCKIPIIEMKIK